MPEKVRLNFDAPEALDNQIAAYADAHTLSKAEAIRRLIDRGLDHSGRTTGNSLPAALFDEDTPETFHGDSHYGIYEIVKEPELALWALTAPTGDSRALDPADHARGELLTDYIDAIGRRVRRELSERHGEVAPTLTDRQIGWISLMVDFHAGEVDVLLSEGLEPATLGVSTDD